MATVAAAAAAATESGSEDESDSEEPTRLRRPKWTISDSARLIELARYPNAQSFFYEVSDTMDRQTLDDKARRSQAWDALAEMFNDYKTFKPTPPADRRLSKCNPNAPGRPQRPGNVLTSKFSSLKSKHTVTLSKFNVSGNHNGNDDEKREDYWRRFAKGNVVLFYMYEAWHGKHLEFTSRLLPEGNGREEGVNFMNGAAVPADPQQNAESSAATLSVGSATIDSDDRDTSSSMENSRTPRNTTPRIATSKRAINKRKASDLLAQTLIEISTPPKIKQARASIEQRDSESLATIAEALMKSHEAKQQRSNLKMLYDLSQNENLDEEVKNATKEQLLKIINSLT